MVTPMTLYILSVYEFMNNDKNIIKYMIRFAMLIVNSKQIELCFVTHRQVPYNRQKWAVRWTDSINTYYYIICIKNDELFKINKFQHYGNGLKNGID